MLALKLVSLLFLALAVVGLNLQSSHDPYFPSPITFQITNTYSLPVVNYLQWSDFTGLGGNFTVGSHNALLISYNLQLSTNSTDYFVARLLIDGVEDPRFRTISSGSNLHSNSATLPVYLGEGTHSAKVQFRSVGAVINLPYEDWEQAFLQINYLWSGSPICHHFSVKLSSKSYLVQSDFICLRWLLLCIFLVNLLECLYWKFEGEFLVDLTDIWIFELKKVYLN